MSVKEDCERLAEHICNHLHIAAEEKTARMLVADEIWRQVNFGWHDFQNARREGAESAAAVLASVVDGSCPIGVCFNQKVDDVRVDVKKMREALIELIPFAPKDKRAKVLAALKGTLS